MIILDGALEWPTEPRMRFCLVLGTAARAEMPNFSSSSVMRFASRITSFLVREVEEDRLDPLVRKRRAIHFPAGAGHDV